MYNDVSETKMRKFNLYLVQFVEWLINIYQHIDHLISTQQNSKIPGCYNHQSKLKNSYDTYSCPNNGIEYISLTKTWTNNLSWIYKLDAEHSM